MKFSFLPHLASSLILLAVTGVAFSAAPPKKEEAEDPNAPVSYYKKVRPVLQAQ